MEKLSQQRKDALILKMAHDTMFDLKKQLEEAEASKHMQTRMLWRIKELRESLEEHTQFYNELCRS